MAESMLTSNYDIIFMILSLLPIEALLRVKSVCRTWAQVISDPVFARAHSSRPTPIRAFFMLRHHKNQYFKPFQLSAKFPPFIMGIRSSGFRVVSSSYGLLCFRRDWVFIVCNPATFHWSVLHSATPNFPYQYHGAVLIYDLTVSIHFKLAVALIKVDNEDNLKHHIKFNIYSSETSSWTVSSLFRQCWNWNSGQWWNWNSGLTSFDDGNRGSEGYSSCKIGGGSICWINDSRVLVGYEISTDTYWQISTPSPFDKPKSAFPSSYNSTIYFSTMDEGVTKVWRLEGKDSWVLEGECRSEELERFIPIQFAYDPARGALIVVSSYQYFGQCFALHLSSSRLNILSQEAGFYLAPWDVFDFPVLPHANTLAPLHGSVRIECSGRTWGCDILRAN